MEKKNMVLTIANAGVKKNGMTRANFRVSEELWANFDAYCTLKKMTRTDAILAFMEETVDANRVKIEAYKRENE